MSTPQYQWIAKSGSNVDVDLLKELSKLKPLDEEDFHPLQKRESQHLQQTQKVKTERNPIKGIQALDMFPHVKSLRLDPTLNLNLIFFNFV